MLELKRNIRSKYFLLCFITVCVCFGLGYILLIGLDKIEHPAINQFYASVYTVFTQFGMLIFSVLVTYIITSDYKGKNILFYKLMGYNWLRYYLNKICVIFISLSVPTIILTVFISIIYGDFSYCSTVLLYLEFVLIYEVLITSFFGFLFSNLIVAFIFTLSFWLITIIMATVSESLQVVSYYDAANKGFTDFMEYLSTKNAEYLAIGNNSIYSIALFCIVIALTFTFRKRWEKNGI